MTKKPIVIIASMEIGIQVLLKKMEHVVKKNINKYEFYEGMIHHYPVVVCHCHVMSFNAAVATTLAIQTYHPLAIINEGCSGAHGKEIHKNDIVIGKRCINIVSNKTPHKKEGEGSNSLDAELVYFLEGEDEKTVYQPADQHLVELCKNIPYSKGNVFFGTLGSGDVWNNEADKILHLHEKYGTLCEDMESIAIYYVAHTFSIPVIGIRVISNNEILEEGYDRNIESLSQEFAYELILKIIADHEK